MNSTHANAESSNATVAQARNSRAFEGMRTDKAAGINQMSEHAKNPTGTTSSPNTFSAVMSTMPAGFRM